MEMRSDLTNGATLPMEQYSYGSKRVKEYARRLTLRSILFCSQLVTRAAVQLVIIIGVGATKREKNVVDMARLFPLLRAPPPISDPLRCLLILNELQSAKGVGNPKPAVLHIETTASDLGKLVSPTQTKAK